MASVLFMATPGWAQETAGKWEIEFHGGGGLVNNPTDGTGNLPTAGPPFTSIVGTTSRRTSSWYFGDGAVLLNQVNAALGVAQAITPLDPVLKRSLAARRRGASFGFRVRRVLALAGSYRVSLRASSTCGAKLPADAMVREYVATVTQDGSRLTIVLSGAEFAVGSTGVISNRFGGRAKADSVELTLGNLSYYYYYDSWGFVERLTRPQIGAWGFSQTC